MPDWSIVIPLKPASTSKSRLVVPGVDHLQLVRAIALDTIHATAACPCVAEIAVVTSEPLEGLPDRTRIVHEVHPSGIAAAVARGEPTLRRDTHHAVLLGDLPGLDPAELNLALVDAALVARAAVADADGVGTTMVTARQGLILTTRFGPASYARHLNAELEPLRVPRQSSLRRDVDTSEHLARAYGPRTASVLFASAAARETGPTRWTIRG